MSVQRRGIAARLFAWHQRDVVAIEVDRRRAAPEPIQVSLRMQRFTSQYFLDELEKLTVSRAT